MKPGSLIARLPNTDGLMPEQPMPDYIRVVHPAVDQPVVLLEWKFGLKGNASMFYLAIDGYHEYPLPDNAIYRIWYDYNLFRELQPPMDMSFVRAIQEEHANQILTPQTIEP